MAQETVFRTVHQYSRDPLPKEDMEKLEEIAGDYCHVKNYVYQRYGGIGSLPKIYPGYTVQNEMTKCGIRQQLGLPTVFFYCAIFDALGDIKSQWSHLKNRVEKSIRGNPGLTPEDRHYLRFVMKQGRCFEAVLAHTEPVLEGQWKETWDGVREGVDEHRLRNYLCRQVRKHLHKLHTEITDSFSVTSRGYRYGDGPGSRGGACHGIYLSTKESRRRVFIPLTDGNQYERQLRFRLYPEEGKVKINVPVETKARPCGECGNEVGVAVGMETMFVTDRGNAYGSKYGAYQYALTEYVREGLLRYHKNARNNPGRKKYNAGKERLEAALHTYVNAEIRRMLETEGPKVVYVPKLPQVPKAGYNKKINNSVSMWQRGYVRQRLAQKCAERSIRVVEVFGKDISNECSGCGTVGAKARGTFTCGACGLQMAERENTARNVLKRGREAEAQKENKNAGTQKESTEVKVQEWAGKAGTRQE